MAKMLDFRFSESLKMHSSGPLVLPNYTNEVEFSKNFLQYPPIVTIGISIIVYLIPQHFSWFKNYKLHGFSNSFLTFLSLMPKQ